MLSTGRRSRCHHGASATQHSERNARNNLLDSELRIPPPQYSLAPHVFFCRVHDGVVFLDLKQDKYFSLADADLQPISRFISDLAIAQNGSAKPSLATTDDSELLETLERSGILILGNPAFQRPALPPVQQTGLLIDLCEETESVTLLRGHHLFNFLAAFLTTLWALHGCSLGFAIQRVVRRKTAVRGSCFDLEQARQVTSAFRRIRPYFFTAHDWCLFHALLLTDYLARYGIFPTFVIGVKVTPWSAHAWVQHGNHVLDTSPEKTFSFTPIFAV